MTKGKQMQHATATIKVTDPMAFLVPDVQHNAGVTTYREPRISARVALRDDPLGQMYARKQIGASLYRAGRTYQAAREAMGIGSGRSPSDLREHVDGGQIATDGITDAKVAAAKRIAAWRLLLGEDGYRLVEAVLIDKRSIRQVADASRMMSGKAATTFYGHLFRRQLSALAKAMGLG